MVNGTNTENRSTNGKRVVGLYSSHQSSEIKISQLSNLTHAIFTYIHMAENGTIGLENDRARERFYYLKSKAKGEESDSIIPSLGNQESNVKLMISIGGPDNSQHFSSVLADLELRKMNEKYIISIVAPNVGIDNWEYGFDLDGILHHVDFINVLTLDYYGPWPSHWGNPAGPLSPLYSGVEEKKNFNVDFTMQYYKQETSNPSKFNIILPFFARLWRHCQGPLVPGKEVFRHVELKNGEAKGIVYMSRWTVEHDKWDLRNATWDEETKTSFVYSPRAKTFISFESDQSIAAKIDYVKKENFGGIWIWCVDHDDDRNSLLNAVSSHNLPSFGLDNDNNFNG